MNQFLKDYNLLNDEIMTKEQATVIFTKRCPSKVIDFPAFIDILYKISKLVQSTSTEDRTLRFQMYLDNNVLNKHDEILAKTAKSTMPNIVVFGKEYTPENEALRIMEGHDDLLKHLFSLYESFDYKIHSQSIIHLKDYSRLVSEFCLVPLMCTHIEATNTFRRFELNDKNVVDFKGFAMSLCCIAHIGLERGKFAGKYDIFGKKLLKFFSMLQEINSQISDELLLKNIKTLKHY